MELVQVRQGLGRIGLTDEHALHVAPAQGFEQGHGVVAGLGRDAPFRQAPELFHFGPVLGIGHHSPGGQQMGQCAAVAHAAAGIGLSRERERRGAGAADLAREQMQIVDQVVGENPLHPLVDAHAPEAHGRRGFGKGAGRRVDLLHRDAADFRGLSGRKFSRKAL